MEERKSKTRSKEMKDKPITLTSEELVRVFRRWDDDHRENPHKFLHYTQVMQMSPEEAAKTASEYFLKLLQIEQGLDLPQGR